MRNLEDSKSGFSHDDKYFLFFFGLLKTKRFDCLAFVFFMNDNLFFYFMNDTSRTFMLNQNIFNISHIFKNTSFSGA